MWEIILKFVPHIVNKNLILSVRILISLFQIKCKERKDRYECMDSKKKLDIVKLLSNQNTKLEIANKSIRNQRTMTKEIENIEI